MTSDLSSRCSAYCRQWDFSFCFFWRYKCKIK
nr:MAG TPA: hypothetical protein [Caudoviricetes sp.]